MTTKRFFITFGVNVYLNVAYQLAILQIDRAEMGALVVFVVVQHVG